MPAIPVFLAALGGMFLNLMGSFLGQLLVNAGVAVITYKGIDIALDTLKQQALNAFSGLPYEMVSLLAYMKVGVAISIITSALATRLAMEGLQGAVKKFVKK